MRAPLFFLLLLATAICTAQTQHVRVGIVTDGPTDRVMFSPAMVERELANVVGPDMDIRLPADKRIAGNWTLAGVDAALDRALADKDIDMVLTLGVLASHQAAQRARLPKPVIAPLVIDPKLQGFPLMEGTSGRKNFTYVADFQGLQDDVATFQRIVGFKHLVALVDDNLFRALPDLQKKADQLASTLQTRISLVRVTNDPAAALATLPKDADALYVTGLLQFSEDSLHELARGLSARRLPSFSIMGRSEIESGLLLATGGAQRDVERLARRVALAIQRIAQGEDAATFEVGFPTEQQLIINMRTAREIGFSPRWDVLTDAEQIDAAPAVQGQALTLLDAMRLALEANPALAASRARLESSADDIQIARSSLLPALDATATRTQIDKDRANPLIQSEKTTSAGLEFQQILFSEGVWANYSISRSLFNAARESERQDMLDTLSSAASAYLDLLRAKSIEAVRRSNVENTRKNLETARVRETVGLGGRSDRLRWVAELARDKQDVLAAEATRRQAEAELARILHRSSTQPFTTVETGLDDPLTLVSGPRMQAFLDTPAKWAVFTDYAVNSALEHAPEIAQADAIIESRRRALSSARRSFYLPDLALVSNGSKALERSGAGAERLPGTPNDESWSVSVQATLPIFTGTLRGARLSQARHELRASEADSAAAKDGVEARTRAALHRTSSSYPSIALSAEAAAAANENLAMVTDAYARGAVSITDLIDAQDTALSAGLAAADAKYGFLTDFVGVLRAMSEFEILLDPSSREAWLKRVEEWFATHPSR
jgi:outer membrane protein TolC/ABC-type uncharacterized transport system substrate-binding protein